MREERPWFGGCLRGHTTAESAGRGRAAAGSARRGCAAARSACRVHAAAWNGVFLVGSGGGGRDPPYSGHRISHAPTRVRETERERRERAAGRAR